MAHRSTTHPHRRTCDTPRQSVWQPAQYERYAAERRRPFFDLLAAVEVRPAMHVLDLGCGTGQLTLELHGTLAARETVGVDDSATMLAQAQQRASGGVRFVQADLRSYEPEATVDLVFSNAALHWVPGHEALIARLAGQLAPTGQLAIQVPCNGAHPSHAIAAAIAAEDPFREALGGYVKPDYVLGPARYAALLARLGFPRQRVWLEVYGHWLSSRDDVFEWVRGTTLTAYQSRMSPALFDQYLDRYAERLRAALPDDRPYFYTFERTLMWAARGSLD